MKQKEKQSDDTRQRNDVTAFTSEPWRYDVDCESVMCDAGWLALVEHWPDKPSTGKFGDSDSDGKLMAAAPELYAACKALLDAFEGYEMLAALASETQAMVRAAIAKADGKE